MKKIFKVFSLIIIALACLLVPFGALTKNVDYTRATFSDTYINKKQFINNSMFLEYAGDNLVGIDKEGYVYQSKDGTLDSLTNINVKLPIKTTSFTTNNSAFAYGVNDLLTYNNGTLVFAGFEDDITQIYTSTDAGKNWIKTNIGSKQEVGYPISLTYGNGIYALMTALVQSSDEKLLHAKIYTSSNGTTWTVSSANIPLDYGFSFSGGYFFRTEYFNTDKNPEVYYSTDAKTWTSFRSPIDIKYSESGSVASYMNPNLSVAYINNSFYLAGFGEVYTSTTLGSWRKVADNQTLADAYKMVPYQNGAIFCSENKIVYADLGETDVTNITVLWNELSNTQRYYSKYANTVISNDKYLIIGFNGYYGQTPYASSEDEDSKTAQFQLYSKAQKHTVTFVDYNGNKLSSIDVVHGQLAGAPTNPSREGYTFTGWDYDLTQPITNNTVITAEYEINKLTVRFIDGGQVIKELVKEYGTTLTEEEIPIPVKEGYLFKGWDKATTNVITSDITYTAVFSQTVTLTIKYPGVSGTFGLLNQFNKLTDTTKVFSYTIGDPLLTSQYQTWYNETILPWANDFTDDGDYDYNKKFIGLSVELPEYINSDIEVTINSVDLYNVRLEYYSQLRFKTSDNYYYCFVGYLKTEKLVEYGYIFDAEDFKREDIDYEVYNAHKNEFYNNLENFEFLGWDYDTTKPVSEDLIIKGQYKMPTINVRMFDAEDYMFNEENQEISFMTIEDLEISLNKAANEWDKFREGLRLFFTFRWGELGENIADQIDLENYIKQIKQYHNEATQILTAFVRIDTDNPNIYSGVFKNGSVKTTSQALSYHSGTANENNMTYWISPVVFVSTLYPLTCTVTYGTALDSAIKAVSNVFDFIADGLKKVWNWFLDWWWVIAIVVLLIIFRKEVARFIKIVFAGIGKFFKWIGSKIKSATKKNKKAKKEYKQVKKQSKKKGVVENGKKTKGE